jgi:hypothetical protein
LVSQARTKGAAAATLELPRGFVAPAKSAKLAPLLEKGERVLWTGHADIASALRTQIALWWLGMPWTIGALVLIYFNLIPQDWRFLVLVVGGVFLAAPFLLAFHAAGAIYAITNRRAIIKRDALGQKQTVLVPFDEMDENLEVMQTRGTTGHLYFASKRSTKLADADYDGKLAFRELPRAQEVADLLNRIRRHGKPAAVPARKRRS